ncbi:MAG: von Willebrand factor type A domain-containing protein [Verrucomicrobia bacterium]|nr:von Willebrand factor type A domain-containing protein [Verrucomicrobiota bacterium]
MKPDSSPTPPETLEARLTALLLGELTPAEAAEVRAALAQDAELARLHERLKLTIALVREAAASPAEKSAPPAVPVKMSPAKREKLLARFKVIAPKELSQPRRRIRWYIPASIAAAVIGLLTLAGILFGSLFGARFQIATESAAPATADPEKLHLRLARSEVLNAKSASPAQQVALLHDTAPAAQAEERRRLLTVAAEVRGKPAAKPAKTDLYLPAVPEGDALASIDPGLNRSDVNGISQEGPGGYSGGGGSGSRSSWYRTAPASGPAPTGAEAAGLMGGVAGQGGGGAAGRWNFGDGVQGATPSLEPPPATTAPAESKPASVMLEGVAQAESRLAPLPLKLPAPSFKGMPAQSQDAFWAETAEKSGSSFGLASDSRRAGSSVRGRSSSTIAADGSEVAGRANVAGRPANPVEPGLVAGDVLRSHVTADFLTPKDSLARLPAVGGVMPREQPLGEVAEKAVVDSASIPQNSTAVALGLEPAAAEQRKELNQPTPPPAAPTAPAAKYRFGAFERRAEAPTDPAAQPHGNVPLLGDAPAAGQLFFRGGAGAAATKGATVATTPARAPSVGQPAVVAGGAANIIVANEGEPQPISRTLTVAPGQKAARFNDENSDRASDVTLELARTAFRQRLAAVVKKGDAAGVSAAGGTRQAETTERLGEVRAGAIVVNGVDNLGVSESGPARDTDEKKSKKLVGEKPTTERYAGYAISTAGIAAGKKVQVELPKSESESLGRLNRLEDRAAEKAPEGRELGEKRAGGVYSAETVGFVNLAATVTNAIWGVRGLEGPAVAAGKRVEIALPSGDAGGHQNGVVRIESLASTVPTAGIISPAQVPELQVARSTVPAKPTEEDRAVKRPANAPIPQPEVATADNAFSTFSLNVSDVSFKLAAASLEKGIMPDVSTLRSEEFINAFDYRDPEPPPGVPVAFAWERARYPFAHNRDLLRFSVKTAARGREAGKPLNLTLLLDNSGSMERADRVRIIQESLRVLASQLKPQDKISVVTFSRTPRLWIDGLAGSQAGGLAKRVGDLAPQGGTNLEDAMDLAYQTAARHYLAGGVNRVVLLTDGAANLGNVDPEALKQKVEAQRKQGIALDCFGIGWEGYNDDLLEVLSRNGDGRYGFVNTPEEAATEFAGQLAGALQVAASDVKVQVEFNPRRVTAYRQIGYAKHQLKKEQFRDNTVDAAEIAAAEAGNALYTVEVNPNGEGPLAIVRVRFKVPGTSDYREHEWAVPFTGNAVAMEQASPAMRLAASASAFSEWLASSPFAVEVTPDRLLGYLRGVPEVFGADGRPKKLEWMIRQAKSLAGK